MPEMDLGWLPIVNFIVLLSAIIGGFFKYASWKAGAEERARKLLEAEEKLILRVCVAFINSDSFKQGLDQRIKEIYISLINKEFSDRAPSFVDSGRYTADTIAIEKRLVGLDSAIRENTKELGNVGGQITAAVTTQLTQFLTTKVFAGKD